MNPKAAIIIPTYNSALTLAETLESILLSQHLALVPIYVLDGGSTDQTPFIVESYKRRFQDKQIDLCSLPGVHPAERVNQFIDQRMHEYTFICHSDDLYIGMAMERMLSDIESTNYWAIGAQCLFFQHPCDAALSGTKPYAGEHMSHPTSPDDLYCEMAFWWCVSCNTLLLRTEAVADSGIRLDHKRYQFCNDYNLSLQGTEAQETVQPMLEVSNRRLPASKRKSNKRLGCLLFWEIP
jgi:hypothetical protein